MFGLIFKEKLNYQIYKTMARDIKCNVGYDPIYGKYVAWLLGAEFSNQYGQGNTVEEAIQSLKIRVYQLRRLRDGVDKYLYN